MKSLIEKLASALKKAGVAVAAIAMSLCLLPAHTYAQGVPPSGAYSVIGITLPYSTLAAGAAGSGGTSTNLAAGWSAILTNVTTYTTWNSSSNAFISVTNTTYTTNTTYADMPIALQKDLTISVGFNASSGVTNRTLTFARFLDQNTVDTANTWSWTIPSNGNTNQIVSTNFPASFIGGCGGVRLITDLWTSTNAITMTNNFLKYAVKRDAF